MEDTVEITVANKAEKDGWFQRKMKWIGRRGGPDRFFAKGGRVVLIEFKDRRKEPEVLQVREHKRLKAAGVETYVVDTVRDGLRILGVKG